MTDAQSPGFVSVEVDYKGRDLKVWAAWHENTITITQPGPADGADGVRDSESRWERGAFEAIKRVPIANEGAFVIDRIDSYDRNGPGNRPIIRATGRVEPLPPHVLLSTYDVGHQVVIVAGVHLGQVGTITGKRYDAKSDWPVHQIDGNPWYPASYLGAVVPNGDYSLVESLTPGEIRWPVGTPVLVKTSVSVLQPGIVQDWGGRTDDGLCRVYVDGDGKTYTRSRLDLLGQGNPNHPALTRSRPAPPPPPARRRRR